MTGARMKIRWLILVLFFPLLSWAQSFNGQITFQELLPYTGSGYPASISRTAYPASMAFPLAPGDAPSSWWNANGTPNGSNQLGLTTATMGQFRCFAWNGDGSCQRVLVNTEITNNFASTKFYTGVSLTLSGSGNFGGSNLAVDNAKILGDGSGCETTGTSSGYICVDTGAIRAQIKKANFDGFNKVVGSDGTVYINGSSDGLTALGPDTTKTMPAAPSTPTASAVSGGSYTASATLYVKAACVGVSGESVASTATAGIAVGSGQLLQVSAPTCDATPDPTGLYNVYVGTSTSPSAMHLQNIRPVTGTWTEPTACPLGGQGCVNGRGISNYLHGTVVYAGNSSGCGSGIRTCGKEWHFV